MKKKNTLKETNLLLNPLFYFFSITILLICNIYSEALLDKSLEIRMFSLAIMMCLLLTFPVFNKRKFFTKSDFSILKNPFILVYTLLVTLQGVSIIIATNTGEALHDLLKSGSYLVFFIFTTLYIIPQKDSRSIFLKNMVLFTILISAIGIFQSLNVFSEYGFSFANAIKINGNFANKNMFSQILFFGFTFSAYGIYFLKKTWRNTAFFAALISLLLIILLMTRGVWLALFIISIISLIFFLGGIRKHLQKKLISKKRLLIFSGLVGIGLLFLSVVSLQFEYGQSIKNRIENSLKLSDTSIASRIDLWKKTTKIIEENPVLGVGSGNWKIEILKYDVIRYNDGWIVPRRVHNDYLTVISEIGLIGFIVYLTMFGFIVFYLIKTIQKAKETDDKIFALSLLSATIGYICFSFFSFPKERVESQILLNLIFAFSIFLYYQTKDKKNKKLNKKILPILLVFALSFSFLTAFSSWKRMQTEIAINKMYVNLNQNQDKNTIYPLIKDIRSVFVSISPRNSPFLQLKGKFLYALKEDTERVIETYKDALIDSPYHVRTILELANIYYETGDINNALKYGNLAYKYAPDNEKVLLSLAVFFEQQKDFDTSLDYLERISPSKKSNYYPQIIRVLKKKAIVLLEKETNQNMKMEIANLANANEGESVLIIHKRARYYNTSYEYEFLKEVQKQFESKYPDSSNNYVSPLLIEYGVCK